MEFGVLAPAEVTVASDQIASTFLDPRPKAGGADLVPGPDMVVNEVLPIWDGPCGKSISAIHRRQPFQIAFRRPALRSCAPAEQFKSYARPAAAYVAMRPSRSAKLAYRRVVPQPHHFTVNFFCKRS
jgi:hypothetical protein